MNGGKLSVVEPVGAGANPTSPSPRDHLLSALGWLPGVFSTPDEPCPSGRGGDRDLGAIGLLAFPARPAPLGTGL